MTTASKPKRKGGRPSKSGAPARPQLVDPKTGRKYKDTPTNRMKLGLSLGDSAPSGVSTPPIARPMAPAAPSTVAAPATPPPSQGGGHSAGSAAVNASLGLNEPDKPGQTAPATPALPQVSYVNLVKIANMILAQKVPEAKMTPDEEEQIGVGLDAVIAKHFPNLKEAGAEFALALAVSGWVIRAILPIMTAPEPLEVPDSLSGRGDFAPSNAEDFGISDT